MASPARSAVDRRLKDSQAALVIAALQVCITQPTEAAAGLGAETAWHPLWWSLERLLRVAPLSDGPCGDRSLSAVCAQALGGLATGVGKPIKMHLKNAVPEVLGLLGDGKTQVRDARRSKRWNHTHMAMGPHPF